MSTELGSHTALAVADSDVGIILEHKGTAEQMHKPQGSFGAFGMPVTVQGLTYSVRNSANKQETLYLLREVTGYFRPGCMTALMGPSGSGKTTLLDLLAGRKTVGGTEGKILFAGNTPSTQFLRRYTGYVEQFDTLLPILTVEEMLLYTAELKRPLSEPLQDKKEAVEELLNKLALTDCRHVKIGNPQLAKGISGGQAKRTNIGIALITNPRVLFLDEPTSGLDSFTSNEVMTVVKGLVSDGVTIVATIHSPTAYSFSLFDSLMLLIRSRVVYFGPTGKTATNYVKSLIAPSSLGAGLSSYQHVTINNEGNSAAAELHPAEWMMDLFTRADREKRGAEFADAYDASELKRVAVQETGVLAQEQADIPAELKAELATRTGTVTPAWWGFKVMLKYRTRHNYTDGKFLGSRIGDKVFQAFLLLTLYLGIGDDFKPDNYINISAVLFMWITMPAYAAAKNVPSLVLERGLFVRERNDGLYQVITYLANKLFDELAISAVVSVGVAAAAFYGIQLQGSFLIFWLVFYLVLINGVALAYAIASVAPNITAANTILPIYTSTLLFFAGFFFTTDAIPPWWKWYSYINPLRYAWTAVMINQFKGKDPVWIGGKTVLQYYGIDNQSKWANLGYLCCFVAFFLVCAWAALKYKRYAQR